MLFRAVAGYKIEVDGTLPHIGEHLYYISRSKYGILSLKYKSSYW